MDLFAPDWDAEGTTQPNEMVLITHNLRELQDVMSNYVGIVRSDQRLKRALNRLRIIYGETEAAGTSMLYIAKVGFEKLGFPEVDDTDFAKITWPYMIAVPGVIGVMVTLSTAIYFYTHRNKNTTTKGAG